MTALQEAAPSARNGRTHLLPHRRRARKRAAWIGDGRHGCRQNRADLVALLRGTQPPIESPAEGTSEVLGFEAEGLGWVMCSYSAGDARPSAPASRDP
jgi:hypothetical protein